MDCGQVQARLETFLDGELMPESTLEVEAHLDACKPCAESLRFAQAIRTSLCRVIKTECCISAAFQKRLGDALAAERRRGDTTEAPTAENVAWLSRVEAQRLDNFPWRSLTTLVAVAAALAVFLNLHSSSSARVNGARKLAKHMASAPGTDSRITRAGATGFAVNTASAVESALDRLIDYHSSPPTPQVVEEDLIHTFDADVGVRVHAPSLQRFGAFWEGASLIPVTNHSAASLRYRMPRHHVTVYVYDPRKVPLRRELAQRSKGDRTVYLGHWRGYSIAAKENEGIGYALAADLDYDAMSELMTEIH